ncbi:MAG TPA: T9SS type B sorting domain-containing protein, partial [Chitinophagaceae bacterium]|nr:T9SS type B sorting domain-containing protein [Chitinophagaceae bacterium]
RAGPGYRTYIWNDGSRDSTFTVNQPGLYWVEVNDFCGNTRRDSITVSPYNVPVNIGPDRIKCNADTIHISAPPGFINYYWSNNYNINTLTGPQVIVFPAVDTAYYLQAEKLPGCFSYDTVRIKVYTSPPINLGPDKSFCNGDSITLNAGPGFVSYQWSTGQNVQQIIVKNIGQYSIDAVTAEGCHSYDTLQVTTIYPLPVISLDHRSLLCENENRVLDAGAGYSNYQWSTGQRTQTITINGLGLYSVTVTDNKGCRGGDSTRIITIAPAPSAYLPTDTAICNYGTHQLVPYRSYNSYIWSNSSTGRNISITQPGLYWLQVTDQNNCTGRDSTLVTLKECVRGVYVPTAFTPDNNGRNDLFRPLVFGDPEKFEFVVYDRAGQILFRSTTPGSGWDGRFKGIPLSSGVYVWICSYQLIGESASTQKGTVLLMR